MGAADTREARVRAFVISTIVEVLNSGGAGVMAVTKHKMPETMYRASRCCRVLGNPTAYLILRCLNTFCKTPGDLSDELRMPLTTISMTLRHLRQMDLVRYETKGRTKEYWIKDRKVLKILDTIEEWVETIRAKRR